MVEHAPDALDDGEAEADALDRLAASVQPLELLEDQRVFRQRDAGAGVMHLDDDVAAAPPATEQHAAFLGIFDGV